MENLESHGISRFANTGLEKLENQIWSLKVVENEFSVYVCVICGR